MSHYFTNNSDLKSNKQRFIYYFENEEFIFETDNGVFSKANIDFGTYTLLKNIYKINLKKNVLDLGCGYGPIAIILKRFQNIDVDMVDVNPRAIELSKINIDLNKTIANPIICDDILTLNKCYDTIILNPPIRAGKQVIYSLYSKSHEILNKGGVLYIVIAKKHGKDSTFKTLQGLFNEVNVLAKANGYFVICAKK